VLCCTLLPVPVIYARTRACCGPAPRSGLTVDLAGAGLCGSRCRASKPTSLARVRLLSYDPFHTTHDTARDTTCGHYTARPMCFGRCRTAICPVGLGSQATSLPPCCWRGWAGTPATWPRRWRRPSPACRCAWRLWGWHVADSPAGGGQCGPRTASLVARCCPCLLPCLSPFRAICGRSRSRFSLALSLSPLCPARPAGCDVM
jgi:hypothetical protein